jgi:hypothetical protein
MPIAVKCLITCIVIIPISLLLRKIAADYLPSDFSWTNNGKLAFLLLLKKNAFLAVLIALEGVIANISLAGVIIGIPLYFIWGI